MNPKEKTKLAETQDKKSENMEVTLDGNTKHIQWNKQIPLLDAMLNAGINAPHSCYRRTCGTCVCKLEERSTSKKEFCPIRNSHTTRFDFDVRSSSDKYTC